MSNISFFFYLKKVYIVCFLLNQIQININELFICRWSFNSSQVQREVVSIMFMYNFYIKGSMVNNSSLSINNMFLIINY